MNAQRKQDSDRKKLLVSIVVLMLCAVAVAGIAYAAVQTSSSYSGNTIDGDKVELTLSQSSGGSEYTGAGIFENLKVIDAETVKENGVVKSYNVQACNGSAKIYAKVESDHPFATLTNDDITVQIGGYDSDLVTLNPTITDIIINPAGTTATFTITIAASLAGGVPENIPSDNALFAKVTTLLGGIGGVTFSVAVNPTLN